jgi:Lrp/AsnC family transcriptional regulator, leucine-responsive regulatory protein
LTGSDRVFRSFDEIDREILRQLGVDARLPFRSLGAAVGLSPNAAADRVRRLQRDGVIAGFTTVIDPAAAGRQVEALVEVRLAPDWDDERFEAAVARLETVLEDIHVTGRTDHQLRIACRDTAELNATIRRLRRSCGAADTETRIVLHQSLNRRAPRPE